MKRDKLFKKYYKHPKHDYEISDTLSYTDDTGRTPDIAFIYSGRERAKSYEVAMQCLADAWYDDKKFMYVRRYDASVFQIEHYFADKLDLISDMTDGAADGITYYRGDIRLFKTVRDDKTGKLRREWVKDVGYFIPLSSQGSHKSEQFPDCYNMIYEEVLTVETPGYLPGEPERLMNLISTVSRSKEGFRCFLISNTVTRINPYSKAWGLKFLENKPGEVRLTKLYMNKIDPATGEELYYLIAAHYLKNNNELTIEDKNSKRNRIRTSVGSNKWEEHKLFTTLDISFIRQFDILDTVVFEWDDALFLANLVEVPTNLRDMYIYEDDAEKSTMPILYIQKKTTEPHLYTRVYTNNSDRFDDYTTKGFKRIYKIDAVVELLLYRGWVIGADNLTMNDFDQVWKRLKLLS